MVKSSDKNKNKTSLERSTSKSTSNPNKTISADIPKENQQSKFATKIMSDKTDLNLPKTQTPFSIENEIAKIKISIPLTKLVCQYVYRSQVFKALNIGENTHTVNLNDYKSNLMFGPEVEGKFQEGGVPPFYVSLNIHDKILHNAMLDLGASHNIMPKVFMEKLGLEITRPYKDMYSFDSSRVKCLGLIKYLCVTLAQIPAKSLVMDIVVADIPPKYDMILSWS